MAQRKKTKIPLIMFALTLTGSILCFTFGQKYNPNFLWAGLGLAGLALLFFMVTLTRFLRNRSITSGLLISTTTATALYFLTNRFISSAVPRAVGNLTVAGVETTTTSGWFTPLFFAQIGLFAIWFLLLLFIIYVYVRPIKRIDQLLGQIIDAKEIKKLKLGKSRQYEAIAAKLQILADEQHAVALKRKARRMQAQNRSKLKKDIVDKFIKEKEKIPQPANNKAAS